MNRLLASAAAAVAALAFAATAGAAQSAPQPVCTGSTCTITFPYIGDAYAWTVPANISGPIAFDVVGAQGGVWPKGSGARVQASYTANPGDTLTVTPGGHGGESGAWTPGGGGFNGGAPGYYYYTTADGYRVNTFGGGGGGASDVRVGGTDLGSRILVAGGGGGGSWVEYYQCYGRYCDPARYHGAGGDGGRVGGGGTGDNGGLAGGGASQSGGGVGGGYYWYLAGAGMPGIGGNGAGDGSYGGGGGGGGGWYGGGGGTLSPSGVGAGGGGGGSSYAASSLTGVTYTSGYGTSDGVVTATFTISDAPLLVATTPAPTATMGGTTVRADAPYAYRFHAMGNPAPTYSVGSGALPAGLTLDPTTGMLSGTPTTAGTSVFTIVATNAHGTDTSRTMRITVGNAPMFTRMAAPPTAALNMRYRYVFRSTGLPAPSIRLASGALPPGLVLRAGATPGTAVLTGRPTAAGRYVFGLRAASRSGGVTHRVAITVAPRAPMVMESPFVVTRSADGRMRLRVHLQPADSSPLRRVRIAIYAPSASLRQAEGDLPTGTTLPGATMIPDLYRQIANGTATAGAGAVPIDVILQLTNITDPAGTPVRLVINAFTPTGQSTTQLMVGRLRIG